MSEKNNQTKIPRAEIGVIGGSGFYDLIENGIEVEIETPFGNPSDKITVGTINKRRVAFIPRHAVGHKIPPHKIPYQANLWAFKKMGVKRVISPAAVGSLNPFIKPGDFVICDQFVNFTKDRQDTFFNGQEVESIKNSERVAHLEIAEPYCNEMRKVAIKSANKLEISNHSLGTVVIISGPRFSTRAESKFFSNQNWDIINMTVYPEVVLARELGMCYLNIGLVTDYDVGLEGNKKIKPVTIKEVMKIFNSNNQRVKELIGEIISNLPKPKDKKCKCEDYIKEAIV